MAHLASDSQPQDLSKSDFGAKVAEVRELLPELFKGVDKSEPQGSWSATLMAVPHAETNSIAVAVRAKLLPQLRHNLGFKNSFNAVVEDLNTEAIAAHGLLQEVFGPNVRLIKGQPEA